MFKLFAASIDNDSARFSYPDFATSQKAVDWIAADDRTDSFVVVYPDGQRYSYERAFGTWGQHIGITHMTKAEHLVA